LEREKDITQLFNDFINNTCTPSEIDRLLAYFGHPDSTDKLSELVYSKLQDTQDTYSDEVYRIAGRVDLRLKDKVIRVPKRKKTRTMVWWAAAVILIGIAGIWWRYDTGNQAELPNTTAAVLQSDDIDPGGSHARLLLSNGKTLNLNGSDQIQDNINGAKIHCDNGQLSYTGAEQSTDKVQWNTLEVPMGGTFEMKLPDGTKVWLNANSKLHFPDQFAANERQVKVEGEAFFEVTKDAKRPFKVQASELNIAVLGTSFNVRAYNPRHISTTLVTGLVQASYQGRVLRLHPGKKVTLNTDNNEFRTMDADLESAMAWKDGYFYFKDEALAKILQDVALWYNLKVTVEGTLPNGRYSGSVDRNSKLSGVLSMIKAVSGAEFVLKEKNLIVKPK